MPGSVAMRTGCPAVGRRDALPWRGLAERHPAHYTPPHRIVGTQVSRSTAWLEKACAERFNRLAYLKMDPVWRGLRRGATWRVAHNAGRCTTEDQHDPSIRCRWCARDDRSHACHSADAPYALRWRRRVRQAGVL